MNFDELRHILHETATLIDRADVDDAERIAARTRALARTFEAVERAGVRSVLVFRLGTERYGWLVENIRSIGRLAHVTPVPFAPPYYRGVSSLRGQVLSILDLGVFLGLPNAEAQADMVIVIGTETAEFKLAIGVLADDVLDVVELPPSDVAPALGDLITGISTDGVSLLDAEGLLRREWERVQGVREAER